MTICELIDARPRGKDALVRLHGALAASGPVVHKRNVYAADGGDAIRVDAITEERATAGGWLTWEFPYADDAHAAACLGLPLASETLAP